jgi:hypothetical protein
VSFLVSVAALNAGAMLLLDDLGPGVRDPEYARRVAAYRARRAETPGRSMALVIGSSRAAMGIRPSAWEAVAPKHAPAIFNLSLLGSGPVMELLVARRAFADGLRPSVVLYEYWPPYLHSSGIWEESKRIAVERLSPADRSIIRDYFPDPERALERQRAHRWNPIWESRERLLVQLFPRWLRNDRRIDWMWDDLDGWGWKPGFDYPPGFTSERARMLAACSDIYRPLFANYQIAPSADRALRESIGVARAHGSAVGLVVLPESTEFRALYSPAAERQARGHLARLSRELGLPVINAREWIDDGFFVDGFHLSRVGAAEFTRKLGPAVAAAFPEVQP